MKKREKKLKCFDDFLHFMNELHWTFFFCRQNKFQNLKKKTLFQKKIGRWSFADKRETWLKKKLNSSLFKKNFHFVVVVDVVESNNFVTKPFKMQERKL